VLRRWPIFVWAFLISAIADHPALDDLPAPPSFSQQEVVPLALQYRLQALQTMEHAHELCAALHEALSCGPTVEVAETRSGPTASDPLYAYMSLQL
jgi:hypothetical protein